MKFHSGDSSAGGVNAESTGPKPRARGVLQAVFDFITFPVRALLLHAGRDRFGMTSLASERYYYSASETQGYTLDVGCGPFDRFIKNFLHGNGIGIDVFAYEGLTSDQIVEDISRFPFADESFDSVVFIANMNHVPRDLRDVELAEAYRTLKPGGNVIVTMGLPMVEILVHKFVALSDRLFGTKFDIDTERGMHEDEDFYVTGAEIRERLARAGFINLRVKWFNTQWRLNRLFTAYKPLSSVGE